MARPKSGSAKRKTARRHNAPRRFAKKPKTVLARAPRKGSGAKSAVDESLIPGRIQPEARVARGPRKLSAVGTPPPRLVNHKARSGWFQSRAAWPLREAPIARVVRERELATKTLPQAPGTSQWEAIGPSNIGGRLTSAVCDPQHPERIWVGAAGGGVWHSPDAGATWRSQWHDEDVLNVGSLAIDPTNADLIYCGTGEANLSADSYAGVGLYRTIDSGSTWQLLAPSERTGIPRRIGTIAIDPFDGKHLLLGGIGFNEVGQQHDFGGLYVSKDAGVSWIRLTFASTQNYWCHAIVCHPSKRGLIYATVTAQGVKSGIYRSKDGGATWTQLSTGLPSGDRFGRTSLAVSPSNPSVLYAFASDQASGRADQLLGVFKTSNGGDSWTNVAGTHFRTERQISYNNTIVVHPAKSNHVLCGGVDLHLTTDGGATWRKVTKWNADRGTPGYAHADHHALVMPAAMPGRVYDANDGGLDVSDDAGTSWTNRSNGLSVTMFYDMDVAQNDERTFGGGSQDNGTLVTTAGRPDGFFELLGGDGGWIVFDPNDASHVFASYYNLNIYRFRDGGYADVSPPATPQEKNAVWMAFIEMDPNDSKTLFCGSSRVWRTVNDGTNWTAVSSTLDGSSITAIEITRQDSRRVYIGTENGGIFRSDDKGSTWTANLAGPLPGHSITRLATSPTDKNRLFATLANFGHSHVFRSDDGGHTWADVDRLQLPDVPHYSIVIRPDAPDVVYVCNDVGVFVSATGGGDWKNLSRNLPRVMVVDLVYNSAKRTLSAATYGRSMYRLAIQDL